MVVRIWRGNVGTRELWCGQSDTTINGNGCKWKYSTITFFSRYNVGWCSSNTPSDECGNTEVKHTTKYIGWRRSWWRYFVAYGENKGYSHKTYQYTTANGDRHLLSGCMIHTMHKIWGASIGCWPITWIAFWHHQRRRIVGFMLNAGLSRWESNTQYYDN